MTVWIVNPFDSLPVEGNRPLRYWLMAEAFANAGHTVTYWTADFNHVTKRPRRLDENFGSGKMSGTVPTLSVTVPSGITIRLVHEPPYFSNIGPRRLWSHWRWSKNWSKAAIGDCPQTLGDCPRRPDLVVVSSPPLAIGREALKFAKKAGSKVIVDVMDAWPETFERVVPRWLLWPLRRLARANYLGADAMTAVADSYADLVRHYGYTGAVRRFYHGISLGTVPDNVGTVPVKMGSDPSEGCFSGGKMHENRKIRVLYAGSLGKTYDLKTAIEAVRTLDDVTLAIAGRGEQEAELRQMICRGQSPTKVEFVGYLRERELAEFLAGGDIGIVPMAPESCVGIPYKLADYARESLAVVSSLGGESDRLLAKYGAGVAYRAGDPQSLAEAIRRLIPRLAEAKRGARRMAEAEFDGGRIYPGYVEFAASVVRG